HLVHCRLEPRHVSASHSSGSDTSAGKAVQNDRTRAVIDRVTGSSLIRRAKTTGAPKPSASLPGPPHTTSQTGRRGGLGSVVADADAGHPEPPGSPTGAPRPVRAGQRRPGHAAGPATGLP